MIIGATVIVALLLSATLIATLNNHEPSLIVLPFDEDRAYNDELVLTSRGPRSSGSSAERLGAEYIYQEMLDAGLDEVVIEEFDSQTYTYHGSSLALVDTLRGTRTAYEHATEQLLLPWSPSLERTTIPMIHVGNGGESDFEGKNVEGCAVFVSSLKANGWGTPVYQAAERGALAVILTNDVMNEGSGFPPFGKDPDPFFEKYRQDALDGKSRPAVFILSKATGDSIDSTLSGALGFQGRTVYSVDVYASMEISTRPIPVVVGTVLGSHEPDEYVMVGGHMDTTYAGQGAVDNTAGTVTVLEMARNVATLDPGPRKSMKFATWGGEEIGIVGSQMWVREHAGDVQENCIVYLNYDMNNVDIDPTRGNSIGVGMSHLEHLEVINDTWELLLEEVPEHSRFSYSGGLTEGGGYTDFYAFLPVGGIVDVPAGSMGGSGCREYHSVYDTPDHIDPQSLRLSAQLYAGLAWWLAG